MPLSLPLFGGHEQTRHARSCAWLVLVVSLFLTVFEAFPTVFDSQRAQASFRVHLRMPIQAEGHFNVIRGQLQRVHDGDGGWRVQVEMDGRSLRFDGPNWMERLTRSDDFLAVDHYPNIRFRSEPFTDAVLHSGGVLHGALTLRGRQRKVQLQLLPSRCDQPGRDCEIEVRGTVSRRAFGMNRYRFTVRDKVDFYFKAYLLSDIQP